MVSWLEEKSYICDSRSRTTYYISTRHLVVVVSWSFVGGVVSVKVFSHIFLSTRRCKWRVPDTRGRDCLPERYELVEENFCNELALEDFPSNEIFERKKKKRVLKPVNYVRMRFVKKNISDYSFIVSNRIFL